jgi:hypothetical protein
MSFHGGSIRTIMKNYLGCIGHILYHLINSFSYQFRRYLDYQDLLSSTESRLSKEAQMLSPISIRSFPNYWSGVQNVQNWQSTSGLSFGLQSALRSPSSPIGVRRSTMPNGIAPVRSLIETLKNTILSALTS